MAEITLPLLPRLADLVSYLACDRVSRGLQKPDLSFSSATIRFRKREECHGGRAWVLRYYFWLAILRWQRKALVIMPPWDRMVNTSFANLILEWGGGGGNKEIGKVHFHQLWWQNSNHSALVWKMGGDGKKRRVSEESEQRERLVFDHTWGRNRGFIGSNQLPYVCFILLWLLICFLSIPAHDSSWRLKLSHDLPWYIYSVFSDPFPVSNIQERESDWPSTSFHRKPPHRLGSGCSCLWFTPLTVAGMAGPQGKKNRSPPPATTTAPECSADSVVKPFPGDGG